MSYILQRIENVNASAGKKHMKSRQSFVIFSLVLGGAAFYFLGEKKTETKPSIAWRTIIPAYITDSIYYDSTNNLNANKIELGRYLFYDRRLSVNKSKSCASCHDPKFSFTDNYR
ncbi:MAG: cytochrome-c peroxidase, partial [Bacteroidota bacterium]